MQGNVLNTKNALIVFPPGEMVGSREEFSNLIELRSAQIPVPNFGVAQVALDIAKGNEATSRYLKHETAFTVDSLGTLRIDTAHNLAQQGKYEVIVILKVTKEYIAQRIICHLWIEGFNTNFTATLLPVGEPQDMNFEQQGSFWTTETHTTPQSLFLPPDTDLLRKLRISFRIDEVDDYVGDLTPANNAATYQNIPKIVVSPKEE